MFALYSLLVPALRLVSLVSCTSYIGVKDPHFGTDVFTGIPFAKHQTRLQPPVPLSGDQGVVIATSPVSKRCLEVGPGASPALGSEDCLTLDIVRPSNPPGRDTSGFDSVTITTTVSNIHKTNLLPVYVFIHGGEFIKGDKSEYDGRNLVKTSVTLGHPIIYVAMNYRLGFLGFPAGKEAQSHNSTNLGLLDQRQALVWLQQNVRYFGGDPKKVTIGGQGSGADSAAYHLLAYGAKYGGLFRGAILQSGSATGSSPIPSPKYTDYQFHYNAITSATGCDGATADSWTCLQNAPIDALVKAYSKIFSDTRLGSLAPVFSPVIDGKFFTDFPSVLTEQGKFARLPLLLGTTKDEFSNSVPVDRGFGSDAAILGYLNSRFPYVSDSTLRWLLTYYPVFNFKNTGPPLSGSQWTRAIAMVNDLLSFCPTTEQGIQVSRVADVYKYRWDSVLQSAPVRQWEGVPRGSDLHFVFPLGGDMAKQTPADLALISAFQRGLISFVNSLDPRSIRAADADFDIIWSKINADIDFVNHTVCSFVKAKNAEFMR
ncbi:uncharacterized protein L3040_007615 [Drepanopeziza brunnea f. sp. 'multigermtubi']|uniref:uncharacterized protein n=1 Tax=Drepanopeziza brunnea f. sp. 'multigermtubi' TaxID=698441 RepID=UPI0023A42EFB|nr:hypothetical protein L3040_007615 [Drepanopeziza brunnea f. sp. 'multigermtubi']